MHSCTSACMRPVVLPLALLTVCCCTGATCGCRIQRTVMQSGAAGKPRRQHGSGKERAEILTAATRRRCDQRRPAPRPASALDLRAARLPVRHLRTEHASVVIQNRLVEFVNGNLFLLRSGSVSAGHLLAIKLNTQGSHQSTNRSDTIDAGRLAPSAARSA